MKKKFKVMLIMLVILLLSLVIFNNSKITNINIISNKFKASSVALPYDFDSGEYNFRFINSRTLESYITGVSTSQVILRAQDFDTVEIADERLKYFRLESPYLRNGSGFETIRIVPITKPITKEIPITGGEPTTIKPRTIQVRVTNNRDNKVQTLTATLNSAGDAYVFYEQLPQGDTQGREKIYTIVPITEINDFKKTVNDSYIYEPQIEFRQEILISGGTKSSIPDRISVKVTGGGIQVYDINSIYDWEYVDAILNPTKTAYIVEKRYPKYEPYTGILANYVVSNNNEIPGYHKSPDEMEYSYIVPTTNLVINKSWVNGETVRPTTLQVRLYKTKQGTTNKELVNTYTLSSNNSWRLSLTNMPLENFDDGIRFNYTVEEVNPPAGFTPSYSGLNITNTYTPSTKQITVTKNWVGGPSPKPNVILQVKKGSQVVQEREVQTTTGNTTSTTFTVPSTESNGTTINYTVDEKVVPENYAKSVSGNTVTNTYVSGTTTFTKEVRRAGGKPIPVTVVLVRNGVETNITRDVNSGDIATFNNLPSHDSNGREYSYTTLVKPRGLNFPEGYSVDTTLQSNGTILYNSPKTNLTITKTWVGGENLRPRNVEVIIKRKLASQTTYQEAKRVTLVADSGYRLNVTDLDKTDYNADNYEYAVEEVNPPAGFTPSYNGLNITNTYASINKQITVTKNWVGGPSPKPNVILQVKKGSQIVQEREVQTTSGNIASTTFTVPSTESNGTTINYTVDEKVVPTNYEKTISGNTITNTYRAPSSNVNKLITVTGGNKQLLPETIEVNISNNKTIPFINVTAVLNPEKTGYVVNENLQTHTENGELITYTIIPTTNIPNYTKDNNGYTYVSPTINLLIEKYWVGGETVRPQTLEIIVKRRLKNEDSTRDREFRRVTISRLGDWRLAITLLDKTNENGIDYLYSVEEANVPQNFTATNTGLTITNRYNPPTKQITVTKNWVGGPSQKPNVILQVKNASQVVQEKEVQTTTGNTASTTFTVPSTEANGTTINYTVDEKVVPSGYVKNIVGNTITNTYTPQDTTVTKKLEIVGGHTLLKDIVVKLYKNGVEVPNTTRTITKTELLNNNGVVNVSYPNMKATDENGNVVTYELRTETPMDNFTKEIRDGNVVFTYTNETKSIPYTVTFEGGNPNNRPQITVKLKNGDQVVRTQTTNGTTTFTNVTAKNSDGSPINYTFEIIENHPNYVIEGNIVKYISPKVEFTATKVWEGGNVRQDVTLNIFRNGVNLNMPKTVREGTVKWTNLDKTDMEENVYTYTMEETTNVPNYRKEYNLAKTQVKNVYVIPKTELRKNITFPNDKQFNVTVTLLKDGVKVPGSEKTVNTTSEIRYTELDKTDINGNNHTYTINVEGVLPDGYSWKLDTNKNIVLEYTSPKLALTVTKAWEGGDLLIPDDIEVSLKRRKKNTNDEFVEVQRLTVQRANNWTKEITNLDKTDSNANEYEYVVEEITQLENFTNKIENFKITNIYVIPTKEYDITVNVDGGDKTKLPNTIEVDIIGKDGVVKTTTLTLNDNKTAYIAKVVLDKTDNRGELINYKVSVKTNIDNYNKENVGSNGTTTITYVSPKIDVTKEIKIDPKLIEKLKEEGKTTIDVTLTRDGENTSGTKTISLNDFVNGVGTVTFTNLDKTDKNGRDYNYDINLDMPDTYEVKKENDQLVIEKKIEKFTKEITADFNGGKLRPTVEVEILRDGVVIKKVKLTNGKTTIDNLDLNDKYGHVYEYTTRIANEDKLLPDYKVTIDENKKVTKVNLTYQVPKTDVEFKLLYPGANGEYPVVKIQLLRDGKPVGEIVTLNGQKEYIFKDVDKTDFEGNEYKYTVEVVGEVEGFDVQVSLSGKTIVLTKKLEQGKILPYAGAETNVVTAIIVLALIIYGNSTLRRQKGINRYNRAVRDGIRNNKK